MIMSLANLLSGVTSYDNLIKKPDHHNISTKKTQNLLKNLIHSQYMQVK